MEMRRLRAGDYDELLEMLNSTFANKYGRGMDFLAEQPRMWVRDDEHIGKHLGIFEDGRLASVVGIYPLPTRIMGESVTFMTTGNVATRPEYEGRGYFTKLFGEIMREFEESGADVARLGGARQRYGRYGFEPCGASYKYEYTATNRIKCFGDGDYGIEFKRITENDSAELKFIKDLVAKKKFYVERGEDLSGHYRALTTKHSLPYIATRGGTNVGYICAYGDNVYIGAEENGRNISEMGAVDEQTRIDMINAWQKRTDKRITFNLSPHENEAIYTYTGIAEAFSLYTPSHFRILNYARLANALIKLKASYTEMPECDLLLGIKDYGTLRLYSHGGECGADLTDRTAEYTVDRSVASRLLFGPTLPSHFPSVPYALAALLPLPLSWNTLDYT